MKTSPVSRLLIMPLILVGLVFGLQACGGGGGGGTPPPPPPVVPPPVNTSLAIQARGYYEGFATIDVTVGGDLQITDPNLKAIVDEKQFVIAYKGTPLLLYKGTFTEVTATTFKASIRVYKDGAFISTATINNGAITAGTSLTGTISGGTGDYANTVGDLELTYNAGNGLVPKTYKSGGATPWNDTPPTALLEFLSNTSLDIALKTTPELDNCNASGVSTTDLVNEQTGRIRLFTTTALTLCAGTMNGQILSGYFTTYNSGSTDDDRMFFVASNDDYAYIGILPCLSGDGTCFTP